MTTEAVKFPAAAGLDRYILRDVAATVGRRRLPAQSILAIDLCCGVYHVAFVRGDKLTRWSAVDANGGEVARGVVLQKFKE